MTEDFRVKVRKDFEEYLKNNYDSGEYDWKAFLAGYMACLKRFGGNGFLPKNPKSAYYKG